MAVAVAVAVAAAVAGDEDNTTDCAMMNNASGRIVALIRSDPDNPRKDC